MPRTFLAILVALHAELATTSFWGGNSTDRVDGEASLHTEERTFLSGSTSENDGTTDKKDSTGAWRFYLAITLLANVQEYICKAYLVPSMDLLIRQHDMWIEAEETTFSRQQGAKGCLDRFRAWWMRHSHLWATAWGYTTPRLVASYGHTAPLMLNNLVATSRFSTVKNPGLGIGTVMGVNMFNLLLLAGVVLIVLKDSGIENQQHGERVKLGFIFFIKECGFALVGACFLLSVTMRKHLDGLTLILMFALSILYVIVEIGKKAYHDNVNIKGYKSPLKQGDAFRAQCQLLYNSRQANAFQCIKGDETVIINAMISGITLQQEVRSKMERQSSGVSDGKFNLDLANCLLSDENNLIRYKSVSEIVHSGRTLLLHLQTYTPYLRVTMKLEMDGGADKVTEFIEKVKKNAQEGELRGAGLEEFIYEHEFDPTICGAWNDLRYKICTQTHWATWRTIIWAIITFCTQLPLTMTMGCFDVRSTKYATRLNAKLCWGIANVWLLTCSYLICLSLSQLREYHGTVPGAFGSTFLAFVLSIRHAVAGVIMAESDKAHDVIVSTFASNAQNILFALVMPWSFWAFELYLSGGGDDWTHKLVSAESTTTHEFYVLQFLGWWIVFTYVVVFFSVVDLPNWCKLGFGCVCRVLQTCLEKVGCCCCCVCPQSVDRKDTKKGEQFHFELRMKRYSGFFLIILYFMYIASVSGLYYIQGITS